MIRLIHPVLHITHEYLKFKGKTKLNQLPFSLSCLSNKLTFQSRRSKFKEKIEKLIFIKDILENELLKIEN